MQAYVTTTTLPVSDPERARDFYVNMLGFEQRTAIASGYGRQITVAPPGADRTITLASTMIESLRPRFAGIVLGTDDLERTYRQLQSRGVRFITAPMQRSDGTLIAEFVDHDGNSLIVVQP